MEIQYYCLLQRRIMAPGEWPAVKVEVFRKTTVKSIIAIMSSKIAIHARQDFETAPPGSLLPFSSCNNDLILSTRSSSPHFRRLFVHFEVLKLSAYLVGSARRKRTRPPPCSFSRRPRHPRPNLFLPRRIFQVPETASMADLTRYMWICVQ